MDRVGRKLDFVFKVGNFEWRVSILFKKFSSGLSIFSSSHCLELVLSLVHLDTELTELLRDRT